MAGAYGVAHQQAPSRDFSLEPKLVTSTYERPVVDPSMYESKSILHSHSDEMLAFLQCDHVSKQGAHVLLYSNASSPGGGVLSHTS